MQAIVRLKNSGRLVQIRQGFYVIVPPRYLERGVPVFMYIDDLMTSLNRQYYVSLFSAAALHGAGHQQPMDLQLMISKPAMRDISQTMVEIKFYLRTSWKNVHLEQRKTETGYLQLAGPELTLTDLVRYHHLIGGIARISLVIEEILEKVSHKVLCDVLKTERSPVIQRVAFLCKRFNWESGFQELLQSRRLRKIDLDLNEGEHGSLDREFKIRVNTELE